MKKQSKYVNLFFVLRTLAAVVLTAGVVVGIYFLAYRAYPAAAEWASSDSREVFVLDGKTYRRAGTVGEDGLKTADYTVDKTVGRVTGEIAVTEDESDGAPDISRDHTYVLYSVKKQADALILLDADGSHAVYYPEVAEWTDGEGQNKLIYKGKTYYLVGKNNAQGLNYTAGERVGYVSRDNASRENASMMYKVQSYVYLILVEREDGQKYLYCREGVSNPPETQTARESTAS